MAGSGSSTVDARERARARRIALDVDRARRDERIEAATAAYIEAFDALAAAVAAGEARLGAAFGALRDEGESVTRIAALCETNAAEVRRLMPANRSGGPKTRRATPETTAPAHADAADVHAA